MYDDKNELIDENDEKLIEDKNVSEEIVEPLDDSDEVSEDTDNQDKAKRIKKEVIEWIKSLALAAIIAILIVKFVFAFTVVDGKSMMPTLHNRDRLIELKLDKLFRSFKRGDIVVLRDEVKTDDNYYVKRVVGLPGEHIEIENGSVFIDGELIDEPYIETGIYTEGNISIDLSDEEYFVLGDNRLPLASRDSRSFGPIDKKSIGGRCVFRVFPFDRIGKLR